jgi:hypothetical protein
MATFPSLNPSQRTYIPGVFASTQTQTLDGDETSVRHSNTLVGGQLRMTFSPITEAELFSIVSHFAFHGTFETFDLSSTTLNAITITIPTGYLWRYMSSPQCNKSATSIEASIELELLPPYLV